MNARKQKRKSIIANRVAGFDLHLDRLVKKSTGKVNSALTWIRYARRNSKIQDNQQAKREKKEHNSLLDMVDSYKLTHGTDIIPTGFGHLNSLLDGGIKREELFAVGVSSPKRPVNLTAIYSGVVLILDESDRVVTPLFKEGMHEKLAEACRAAPDYGTAKPTLEQVESDILKNILGDQDIPSGTNMQKLGRLKRVTNTEEKKGNQND
jgi:hypothetical protein